MNVTDFNVSPHYEKLGIERNVIPLLATNHQEYERKKRKTRRRVFSYFFKSHTGNLLLILGAYTTIILIACIILVVSVFRLEDMTEGESLLLNKNYENYMEKSNRTRKVLGDVNLSNKLFKEFVWPYRDSSTLFNCSVLNHVKQFKHVTSGWTKSVFSFNYNGQSFALKTVNLNGKDLKSCMKTNMMKTCYEKASSKMYKEYILSRELSHANIVKAIGWCVSNDSLQENVAIVTELCSPIDTISLLQMSFRQRLHIIFNIMELIQYLSSSSLGSVAINDFRSEQFVLCGQTAKLTDLDDLSIEEPRCRKDEQCRLKNLYKSQNKSIRHNSLFPQVECIDFVCSGYNEKQNVINMYRHFISLYLPIGMPESLKGDINSFLEIYGFKLNSKLLLMGVKDIYSKFNHSQKTNVGNKI